MCSGYFRLLSKRNWFETTTGRVDLQEDDPDAIPDCGSMFENTKQLLKLYAVDGKDEVDKLDDFTATTFDHFIGCDHEM
ncbi:hypothetical protein SLS56_002875 [Neofusicoccum ribis]|uniref:Uncharacterized protein n=1 Tax=Neofusicoccum ribis TaxID=45134 RepID=A0ABR3T1P2_9PEZI